jgi:hypothetical protein
MRLENFAVAKDNIAVEVTGLYLDLHNCYDFKGINYSVAERQIHMFWIRNDGEWVPKNQPEKITLEFSGVGRFRFRERDPAVPFTEDDCINDIGFMPQEMWEEENYVCEHRSDADDMVISFMSGALIRIRAEAVSCVVA